MYARAPKRVNPPAEASLVRFLFSRPIEILGAVGVFIALLLPSRGLGVPMCAFNILTGAPCPGCGLTRSVTHAAHGSWIDAWYYHPFGITIFVAAAVLGLGLLLPRSLHARFVTRMAPAERPLRVLAWAFLVGFVTFGFGRLALWWLAGWRPPVPL